MYDNFVLVGIQHGNTAAGYISTPLHSRSVPGTFLYFDTNPLNVGEFFTDCHGPISGLQAISSATLNLNKGDKKSS